MAPLLALVVTVSTAILADRPVLFPSPPDYPHVRTTNARVARLIDEAVSRSPTFARLYRALQQTDVILFVETSRALGPSLQGRLMLVRWTPVARYLRAEVRADLARPDLIAAVAHELQHALEIAVSQDVRDDAAVAALYRRIGTASREHACDTDAAYAIAVRVRAEAS